MMMMTRVFSDGFGDGCRFGDSEVAACVGQFFCKYSHDQPECLNKHEVCDGMMDCSNGADERNCPAECQCGERQYLCMGKEKCINIKQICDGDEDCPMDEDETCRAGCRCNKGQYLCGAAKGAADVCIGLDQFCDSNDDCPNGDDEELKCISVP
ncbi:MALR1-like protein [Mya arenaria]|uniref:MALR1-like protein n=1 Tax=Mya arenaria TaxID=6604 RepID=A0ABY7DEP5_MYAAR|nr:MALR1-like protein [Mya arenaria]